MILTGVLMLMICGCNRNGSAQQSVSPKVTIEEGESYETVIAKLGEPNIESSTQSSRVLIYDNIELKLQSNVVVSVYDHR